MFGAPEATGPGDRARAEAFVGYGPETERLVVQLARCLETPYAWPAPAPGGRRADDNPRIPSGYTYLAQLVAHDLTFLGSTLPPMDDIGAGQRNLRAIALNLDTIYAGGPLERPSSFCPAANGGPRVKLRLGMIGQPDELPSESWRRVGAFRDLPRTACPATFDACPETSGHLTEVLVADPRNDDHLIVAQTAVLFHLLHNEACDRIAANPTNEAPEHAGEGYQGGFTAKERDVFTSARRVVAAVYRDILRFDFLKRLLCEPVYTRYMERPDPFLDQSESETIPVEFSHAAFRVGHAMVQPAYKIRTDAIFDLENLLRFNSELSADRMPPSRNWVVRWSHFFELVGTPANLSRRIAPSQARPLAKSPLIALTDDRDDPEIRTGLPRRDLLRGCSTRLRSVESLLHHIRAMAPELLEGSPLLRDENPVARREVVTDFLDRSDGTANAFSRGEKEAIATDPPLLLFLLLEAAVEQDGLCLGVLGSTIVAEVLFRALGSAEAAEAGKVPDMDALTRTVFLFDEDEMAQGRFVSRTPRTMPDLIRWLAEQPSLRTADPPLI